MNAEAGFVSTCVWYVDLLYGGLWVMKYLEGMIIVLIFI